MGKKKKKKQRKPWCFYCDRVFDDEAILVQHQKARHWKCSECNKKMASAGGLVSHLEGVHHVVCQKIPNAKIGRDSVHQNEIYGMGGIPEEYLDWHPEDGEPDPMGPAAKKQKVSHTPEEAAAAPAAAAAAPAAAGALPPGWSMYHDPQGRPYYFNAATNTTQWTPPPAAAPADNPTIGPAAPPTAPQPQAAPQQQQQPPYGGYPGYPPAGMPMGMPQPTPYGMPPQAGGPPFAGYPAPAFPAYPGMPMYGRPGPGGPPGQPGQMMRGGPPGPFPGQRGGPAPGSGGPPSNGPPSGGGPPGGFRGGPPQMP